MKVFTVCESCKHLIEEDVDKIDWKIVSILSVQYLCTSKRGK